MKEEYGSIREILVKNFNYLFSDKRRLVKLGIYLLYLFLFGKRFILVLKYFKHIILKYIFMQDGGELVKKAI
jgi:hypothetical protein